MYRHLPDKLTLWGDFQVGSSSESSGYSSHLESIKSHISCEFIFKLVPNSSTVKQTNTIFLKKKNVIDSFFKSLSYYYQDEYYQ
jgi:hypothetical protein